MKNVFRLFLLFACLVVSNDLLAKSKVFYVADYGLQCNSNVDNTPLFKSMLEKLSDLCLSEQPIVIKFSNGRYDFFPTSAEKRTLFISNHDQVNPKTVGIMLDGFKNVTIDGCGADLMFHGEMLPISILNSSNVILKNLSIDIADPQITQVKIINNTNDGIMFEIAPWVKVGKSSNGALTLVGDDWSLTPSIGIAFEADTRHILYRTSDITINTSGYKKISDRVFLAPNWKDNRLKIGTIVAMRGWYRPCPGVFMYSDVNTTLTNVKVHYAHGMGLLAQMCTNITMDGFSVCLRNDSDPRYFTTQADATHFSGCKGVIVSKNGVYESMMDDAINVHGTYLKLVKRIDNYTVQARYMHSQTYGFLWGEIGDEVRFVKSKTMENYGEINAIVSITPECDYSKGPKVFTIKFKDELSDDINEDGSFGIENLTWTPKVMFDNNIVRNNRARGALFSTPQPVFVRNNVFDHTSGCAILLCGDCNGWYETGACRKVTILSNTFINALTNLFQFTNAIISIYPEIPDLKSQKECFHGSGKGSISIINNRFETFDRPILYAKSVDGLTFKRNNVVHNTHYKPFHPNENIFFFEHVKNYIIENNSLDGTFFKENSSCFEECESGELIDKRKKK